MILLNIACMYRKLGILHSRVRCSYIMEENRFARARSFNDYENATRVRCSYIMTEIRLRARAASTFNDYEIVFIETSLLSHR